MTTTITYQKVPALVKHGVSSRQVRRRGLEVALYCLLAAHVVLGEGT